MRQRNPTHETSPIFTAVLAAATPAVTRTTGTRLSCRLSPPCAYSLPAPKQAIPGATATRSSEFQCHRTVGTSTFDPPLIAAQRAQRLAVRYLGRSTLGKPPGSQSQPW